VNERDLTSSSSSATRSRSRRFDETLTSSCTSFEVAGHQSPCAPKRSASTMAYGHLSNEGGLLIRPIDRPCPISSTLFIRHIHSYLRPRLLHICRRRCRRRRKRHLRQRKITLEHTPVHLHIRLRMQRRSLRLHTQTWNSSARRHCLVSMTDVSICLPFPYVQPRLFLETPRLTTLTQAVALSLVTIVSFSTLYLWAAPMLEKEAVRMDQPQLVLSLPSPANSPFARSTTRVLGLVSLLLSISSGYLAFLSKSQMRRVEVTFDRSARLPFIPFLYRWQLLPILSLNTLFASMMLLVCALVDFVVARL
jgi:hypothetical protein